jgi:hypothetical protein
LLIGIIVAVIPSLFPTLESKNIRRIIRIMIKKAQLSLVSGVIFLFFVSFAAVSTFARTVVGSGVGAWQAGNPSLAAV